MSFILDALKKSEKERQRDAVPGISDLPVVVAQARPSAWLFAVIAGLSVCVVVLAWAWWRTSAPAPGAAVALQPSVAAERPAARATQTAARTATRSLSSEATRAAAATQPAQASSNTAAGGAPRTSETTTASGTIPASAMSILEARAAGIAVPELALELLVFSTNPSQRFVYINSTKYVEGESLNEGPRVIEITPEGVILNYRGTDLLLPQD